MTEYNEKVTRYARSLAKPEHRTSDGEGSIEAVNGGGGCPTCGYGGEGHIYVYYNGRDVGEFDFSRLNEVLAGILDA